MVINKSSIFAEEERIVLNFMKDNYETLVQRGKQDARNYEAILNAIKGIVDRVLNISQFPHRDGASNERFSELCVVVRRNLSAISDAIRQYKRKAVIYMVLACELALEELEALHSPT